MVCLSVCLSVGPSVCLSVHLCVHLSVCPYVCTYVRMSVYPSVRMYLCPPVGMPVCLYVRLPACPYVRLSICPSSRLSVCTFVHMPVCPDLRMSACTSVRMSVCVEVCRQSGLAKMASPQHRHGCWSYSRLKRTADQAWGCETQSERKISSRSAPKCDRGRRRQPESAKSGPPKAASRRNRHGSRSNLRLKRAEDQAGGRENLSGWKISSRAARKCGRERRNPANIGRS